MYPFNLFSFKINGVLERFISFKSIGKNGDKKGISNNPQVIRHRDHSLMTITSCPLDLLGEQVITNIKCSRH